ncbi:putative chemotaxis regulator protein(CheY-like) [Magnetospirillum gryphiswaldense MSR-1 v2]|uniref:Chemotaxis regulator protein(CheY-like) n=1 Tax=Magnetospirillum gryphiswaldense (strain DSM 6361 / JCM 21280 / NBRC 15271 / MSR-1) TaxID=431944 RepID=V6F920_MAGGM|nr:SpoIIE family protein phosphatase [Magnetospirillum gryphiswaldense]CDL01468.1 putative chemotaxis regulator protein(CheY-like) [Magnetospirillum gryphiswaldense MSR-1 v2]
MSDAPARALVVDDERMNREVIVANLRAAGFETVMAEDGVQAWGILQAHPGSFDVILLDRRMPRMNGMELLTRLKADDKLAHIPVIMQTAYAETEDVSEGIKAGAYYYLAKPLDRRLLLSVTEAAIADHQRRQRLADDLDKRTTAILLLEQGRFRFRTLEEGHTLAVALARSCPQARHLAAGLSEMFTNAVEHGNLGIDFDLKAELVAAKRWRQEIEARLDTPLGRSRSVEVLVDRHPDAIRFVIRDQGKGFDWRAYDDISPERAFATHGRGIALARRLAFTSVEYNDMGNEVTCIVTGPNPEEPAYVICAEAPAITPDRPAAEAEETRLARSMQMELLPNPQVLAEAARRLGIQVSAHFEPSSSLGGDLWGMHVIDDNRLALWLADFSGHGLGAALNTFRLHTLVAQCTPLADMPGAFLAEINRRLTGLLPQGQYAAMTYGVIDLGADAFVYAAAAMPAPLFRHAGGGMARSGVERGDGSGLPLGLTQGATYVERNMRLTAGGILVLASDGLTDNPMTDGTRLGNSGMETLLAQTETTTPNSADSVLAPFLARVKRPLRDDLTVLCATIP